MDTSVKESWYLKSVTICLVIAVGSCFPFAAMLAIPLLLYKSKKNKKTNRQLQEKLDSFIQKHEYMFGDAEAKLAKLNEDITNKELLKAQIVSEATTEADELVESKKAEIVELDKKIVNKESEIDKIIKDANAQASQKLEDSQRKLDGLAEKIKNKKDIIDAIVKKATQDARAIADQLNTEIQTLQHKKEELSNQLVEMDEEALMQDFALYHPIYDFAHSENYKFKLDEIRDRQKEMIKNKTAATGNLDWTVNGSKSEGKKMVRDTQKLLLRAFNSECEHVTGKVKYNNFDSCKKRITNSYTAITKLGRVMNISINPEYYNCKIDELHLALEYQLKKQEEKEHQRELREQAREEAKLKKEIAEAKKKIAKEKAHYSNALETAQEQLKTTVDADEKAALQEKITELQEHLSDVNKNMVDIDYRESNQKAGYVYVISNIGSFGKDIYKIGMTRRLDPMERVYELGDASVPFNFDVHAMIFSDDAPKLEAALHHAFEDKKLNMVNTRREFFKVPLKEIEKVVKENYDGTVEFTEIPSADQYRESMKMKHLPA